MNGNTCRLDCASNQYWVSSSNTCPQCNVACGTCSGPTFNECTGSTCAANHTMVGTTCRLNCTSIQWWRSSDNTCQPCDSNCATCNGTGANGCLTCASTEFHTIVTSPAGSCTACVSPCITCSGPTFTQCTGSTCATNHTMVGTTCKLNCTSTQWWKSSDNTCPACSTACLTCQTGAGTNNCLTCASTESHTIVSSPTGTCTGCNVACLTCSGPTFN